ncbi:NADH-quinone oxidoreductase subunit C [Desulfonatronospira sp.]|uniref:NADH-quinone oxidoreductase subunit C n=1 Tax=Desulfonatronospira sp. TaxID=1962951 RepID=UPI0025C6D5CB|nr:NADH-quinone oxidoreductase subunit C [Desulfonatronospira sp.]
MSEEIAQAETASEKTTKAGKTAGKEAKKEEPQGPSYTGYDADFFVAPQDLFKAVEKLDQTGFFLEDVSCIDMQEGFQIVYHFDRFDQPGRVGIRVMVSKDNPEVPSIYDIYPGAAWHERECYDFFGVRFKGHPNLLPLLLAPDHDGPPPLLKDESSLKDMHQLYPDRAHSPVSVDSQEFIQAITNCSNKPGRDKS